MTTCLMILSQNGPQFILKPCRSLNLVQQSDNSQSILTGVVESHSVGIVIAYNDSEASKGNESVLIASAEASAATELKCTDDGKGHK